MKPQKLIIPEQDFLLQFNIVETSHADIRKYIREFDVDSKRLFSAYSELVSKIMSDSERDDILYTMNISFRNSIQDIIDQINQKALNKILEIHYFTLHIALQKKSIELCDQMVSLVEKNMSYKINDQSDPRNMIKKCPYCGLIWFKIEGCDGETTCGNLPSKPYDCRSYQNKTFFKYRSSWLIRLKIK
jgi:hypothetical protein